MKKRFEAVLVNGPVGKALFQMTAPMIWGMLAMMTFNLADTYFVSRLGTSPLAAMGFTFPVVLTVAHVALGLGIATSSVVSRSIGEGDAQKVRRLTTDSLLLSLCLVGGILVIGFFTIDPLFIAMGATRETLAYIRPYMRIWYAGTIFLVFPMVGNHAIRASGDALLPGMIMVAGSVLNIIFDPIFIFGYCGFPAMGIRGAAVATVIARGLTFILSFWVLAFNKKMLTFKIPQLNELINSWRKILYIGLPSAATMMLPTICIGVLTWMVSDFGQEAVAGFGVAGKVEGLALVVFMALSTVFGPFVGQNWGANRINRVRKALTLVVNFSLIFGALEAAILYIFAEPIARIFNHEPAVLTVAILYLKIVPWVFGLVSVGYLSQSAFNALGRPGPAIILMVMRLLILHIPLAYLAKRYCGLIPFLMSVYVAAPVSAVLGLMWIRKILKDQEMDLRSLGLKI